MKRCIELATLGQGSTDPNPMVGCVIVHNDTIIGEGWHQRAGEPHAEVNAVASVKNKALLKEATAYVSLEPCSHHGKTPPCADMLIENKLARVVIASKDPNPQVAGRGIKRLEAAGIEVIAGILDKEAQHLNRRFFTFHAKKRPYVLLKWAQSLDGFIAPITKDVQAPVWISNTLSRQHTHQWRSEESAILIGVNTALADNPSLTTRDWPGKSPVRVVLDPHGKLKPELSLLDGQTKTIVITSAEAPVTNTNLILIKVKESNIEIDHLLSLLYEQGLQSVLIEGGADTLNRFISSGLWDEARVFTGAVQLGNGLAAPSLDLEPTSIENVQNDLLNTYFNPKQL
ncbi:bifunctional diaminohydroxyphosphoribosylaminopyrimidine deaminase/5-amino-6-(5-phosphoribosylamino)uracil reductase RibD [Gilvibacter sp.]|uniref:bifunctional diaminohydroxyphosphoribosylaminopyrimidine deaminase/5-amino-6-(5-phosphoribosylamino)uracil reductase RibD n=1 Tax=Gilvibacter sp. TaxID=2729997 RepID=UPI003454AD2D|nr:bifunctional diaminohydroxyphosphoribosylaminopyrimidine deaminase/5-amino-6-(5-phosphoribosylamino)uracil reductase RibD [Gilvibacter sp.]